MKKILLVEGSQDENFVRQLLIRQKINYGDNFEIKKCNGIDKLRKELELIIKTENHSHIGVIIDADTKIKQYWQNINNSLKNQEIKNLPPRPLKEGTVLEETNQTPRIGIWVMPNNEADGYLETFVSYLVNDDDTLYPIAEKTVNKLVKEEKNLFAPEHTNKAIIYTWLAWQKKAGSSLGAAINVKFGKEQVYILDNRKASIFINWLQKTFKN